MVLRLMPLSTPIRLSQKNNMLKNQELKMNVFFFFFPIHYQIKMLQAQSQSLFLDWIFSNTLNLTSWDFVSTSLFYLLKCRICLLAGNLHFTLRKDHLFNSKKYSLLVLCITTNKRRTCSKRWKDENILINTSNTQDHEKCILFLVTNRPNHEYY